MSTRSRIAVAQDDGSVKSIYCHWDGYPAYNGKMLMQHYNSKSLADALVAMGDMSALDVDIELSTFYNRDRSEALNVSEDSSVEDFVEDFVGDIFEEYAYLYKDGEWVCYIGENSNAVPIAEAVKNDQDQIAGELNA